MEELIRELIDSINNLNKFSWSDAISILSLIGAWITIIILIMTVHFIIVAGQKRLELLSYSFGDCHSTN